MRLLVSRDFWKFLQALNFNDQQVIAKLAKILRLLKLRDLLYTHVHAFYDVAFSNPRQTAKLPQDLEFNAQDEIDYEESLKPYRQYFTGMCKGSKFEKNASMI